MRPYFLFLLLLVISTGLHAQRNAPKGQLFIIGGGSRPPEMMKELVELAGLREGGYVAILPMSSADMDTAAYYVESSLTIHGVPASRIRNFPFQAEATHPESWIDSVAGARLLYFTGGVQSRFMEVVKKKPALLAAIHRAYQNGAIVAGTSAGAAVMSKLMITGEQLKQAKNGSNFRSIEAGNVELVDGLGLVAELIVDQHFVYRMRYNRLISVVLEHPEVMGVGIDESTAVVIQGRRGRVVGEGQVILLRNRKPVRRNSKGLLGAADLSLSVLLPGDKFRW